MSCRFRSIEYTIKHARGWWTYNAACNDCGWTDRNTTGAMSRLGALWMIHRHHRLRRGIAKTAPCPVCDRPSKVGEVLCGDQACSSALAEVRREMPSPLADV